MFSLTLLNFIFDGDNENAILFDSKEQLRSFFDNMPHEKIDNVNFYANDLINCKVYFQCNTVDLYKILNYNYCIVEDGVNDPLYFKILNSKQDSGGQILIDLQIDVFNTYFYNISKINGMILRSHLNRFVKNGDKYKFNFNATSPLFEREDLREFSKRPTELKKLKMLYSEEGVTNFLDDLIYSNVDHWVYYYVNPTKIGLPSSNTVMSYAFGKIDPSYGSPTTTGYSGGYAVVVAPIYKNGSDKSKHIYISNFDGSEYFEWSEQSIMKGFKNDYSGIYAIKHSAVAPFIITPTTRPIGRVNDQWQYDYRRDQYGQNFFADNGMVQLSYQDLSEGVRCEIPGWTDLEFNAEDITNYAEPKLLNEDYSTYRIFMGGNSKQISISKTSNNPKFVYFEPFSPDITKSILIFNPNSTLLTDPIFKDITKNDFTGSTFTMDLSTWFAVDKLDEFLANNKNNLQIFTNQQGVAMIDLAAKTISGLVNSAADFSSKKSVDGSLGLFKTGLSAATSAIGIENEKVRYDLTLDNMRAAPDDLKNINSNPVLINSVNDIGIFIEKEEALVFEQLILIDYLNAYGYSYGRFGNLLDFIKTRTYYNYIQANILELELNASDDIKRMLKNLFSRGIRIWHGDKWTGVADLSLNNKEIFLNG